MLVTVEEDLVYVPGDWVCPECNYRLHKRVIHAATGAVGVSMEEGDTCPNDGYILHRLTWRQDAEDANRVALDLIKSKRCIERSSRQQAKEERVSKEPTYIGDGVYAIEDEDQLAVYTSNAVEITNEIIFEPDTERSLLELLKRRANE